jgi:transposase-like protein
MRYSQAEKMEVIRIVESSGLGVKRTLDELGINHSTFYNWYRRYEEGGYDGLAPRKASHRRFWNAIPPREREKVIELALDHPEKSPRELAWTITDKRGYYISESSVYRILKAQDLISAPAFMVLTARDRFPEPTRSVNELWQTDFTYLKVVRLDMPPLLDQFGIEFGASRPQTCEIDTLGADTVRYACDLSVFPGFAIYTPARDTSVVLDFTFRVCCEDGGCLPWSEPISFTVIDTLTRAP